MDASANMNIKIEQVLNDKGESNISDDTDGKISTVDSDNLDSYKERSVNVQEMSERVPFDGGHTDVSLRRTSINETEFVIMDDDGNTCDGAVAVEVSNDNGPHHSVVKECFSMKDCNDPLEQKLRIAYTTQEEIVTPAGGSNNNAKDYDLTKKSSERKETVFDENGCEVQIHNIEEGIYTIHKNYSQH